MCIASAPLNPSAAEALADGGAEALDGAGHVVLGGGGEGGAEEEAAGGHVLLGAEPGPADGEDALVDARREDVVFDLEDGLGGRLRVLRVVDLQPEL